MCENLVQGDSMAAQQENEMTPKILLVEDNFIAQLAAKAVMETRPHILTVAESGEDAVAKADEDKFDIIFMDIGLGGISGFDATVAIRQNSKLNKDTLIFALTAHEDSEFREKAEQVNMNGYFQKPLTPEYLDQVISIQRNNNVY